MNIMADTNIQEVSHDSQHQHSSYVLLFLSLYLFVCFVKCSMPSLVPRPPSFIRWPCGLSWEAWGWGYSMPSWAFICTLHVCPSAPEIQVIDYQTQQFKLLPLIATAYALMLTGQYMRRMFVQCQAEISQGNLEPLPEVGEGHVLTHTHTHTHTHTLAHAHTCTCTYTHACMHTHMHIHTHLHTHTLSHIHTHMHARTHAHTHTHTHTHTCNINSAMYIYVIA